MRVLPMLLTLLLLLSAAPRAAPARTAMTMSDYAQVIVRSHVVIRVETAQLPASPVVYRERKGPRCVALGLMAGSAVIVPNSVDLALRDGRRLRARFAASCPGLDYYSGFYLVPNADGQLCAGRDLVRDRAGGECPVQTIRRLELRR